MNDSTLVAKLGSGYGQAYVIRERATAYLERHKPSELELRADLDTIARLCEGLMQTLRLEEAP